MRVILKGKEEGNDITFLLDYNKHDMDWQKIIEITEALPSWPAPTYCGSNRCGR